MRQHGQRPTAPTGGRFAFGRLASCHRHDGPVTRGRSLPVARWRGVKPGPRPLRPTPDRREPSPAPSPARAPARAAPDRPHGRALRAARGRAPPVARWRGSEAGAAASARRPRPPGSVPVPRPRPCGQHGRGAGGGQGTMRLYLTPASDAPTISPDWPKTMPITGASSVVVSTPRLPPPSGKA